MIGRKRIKEVTVDLRYVIQDIPNNVIYFLSTVSCFKIGEKVMQCILLPRDYSKIRGVPWFIRDICEGDR